MASNLEDSVVYDCSSNSNDLYIDLDRNEFVSEQDISYMSSAHHDTGLPADESDDRTELAGLDLYSDILTSELQEKQQFAEKAFEDLQNLKTEYKALQEKLKTVCSTLEKMEKQNIVLKYNISALYKTAKAEIERKDSNIHELRERLDSIIFRRYRRNNVLPNGQKISNSFENHKRNIECLNRDDRKNFDEAYISKKDGNEALSKKDSREQEEDTKKQILAAFSSLSSTALKHRKHIQDHVKKLDRSYSRSLRDRFKYKNVLVESTKENLKDNKKENSFRQKKIKGNARIDSYSTKKSVSNVIVNNAKNSLNIKSSNSVGKQKQNSDAECKKFESENREKASNIKHTRKKSLNEHSYKAIGDDITKDNINTFAKCSEETGKRNYSSNLKSDSKNALDKVIDGKNDIIVPNSKVCIKVASNKSIKNKDANGQKRKRDAAMTECKREDKRLHQTKDHVKMNTECRKIFSNYHQDLSKSNVKTTMIKNEKNYKSSDTETNAKKKPMSGCLKKDDDYRKNDTCHESLLQTERKLAKIHSVTPRLSKIHKKDKIHKRHKKKHEKEKHKSKNYSARYLKTGTKMSENSKPQQIICKKKEIKYRSEGELSTSDSEG